MPSKTKKPKLTKKTKELIRKFKNATMNTNMKKSNCGCGCSQRKKL